MAAPTFLTTATDPATFIGAYGNDWRAGLLSEHLDLFVAAGGTFRPSSGEFAGFALIPDEDGGTIARPVVCSELVEVWTEDGRVSGRCGRNALAETGCCPGHDFRPLFCSSRPDADHSRCPSSVECFHA